MNSLLLTTLARGLVGVLFVISLYILYRGHNEPGGGFIGGLVGAVAFALAAKGLGHEKALRMLKCEPRTLIACGLSIALMAGCFSAFMGHSVFTGEWFLIGGDASGEGGFPISNILFFDIGVYLIVLGSTLSFFFCLEDPES